MARKSIKKNYLFNVSYQVLMLLTPLITTPYISRVLGADGIGQYSYTASIVSYFTLFAALGTGTYGQREISYFQDDRKERSQVFWEILILRTIMTLICSAAYIILIVVQKFSAIYMIQYLTLLNVCIDISWFFQGMEEFGKIVLRNTVIKVVNIAFIFIAIHTQRDLNLYVFGLTFTSVISSLSLWFYLPQYIDWINFKLIRISKHWRTAIRLFIPTIAIQVYTVLDKTMIGMFTISKIENGYYEQALKLSKMVLTLVTSLGTVMIPRIGYYFNQNNQERVKEYMYRGYNFVWFLGIPLCFGLIGVSANIVPWFYGKEFQSVASLLSILSFLVLAIGINNVTGMQFMIPTKRENLFTLTVCIGAGVNFLMNLILIPNFYAVGAAIASVVAETTIALVQLYVVRHEFSIVKIFALSWKYLVAGGVMLSILRLEDQKLFPTPVHTLFMVISGACIYFLMLLLMKDSFFCDNSKNVLNQILKKAGKKN